MVEQFPMHCCKRHETYTNIFLYGISSPEVVTHCHCHGTSPAHVVPLFLYLCQAADVPLAAIRNDSNRHHLKNITFRIIDGILVHCKRKFSYNILAFDLKLAGTKNYPNVTCSDTDSSHTETLWGAFLGESL